MVNGMLDCQKFVINKNINFNFKVTRVRLVQLDRLVCLSQKTCLLNLMNFKTFNSLDGVIDTTMKTQQLQQVCSNVLNLTSNMSFISFAL